MPSATSGYTVNEILIAAIFPMGYGSTDISGDLQTHLLSIYNEAVEKTSNAHDWDYLHTSANLTLSNGVNTYDFGDNSLLVDQIENMTVSTSGKGKRIHPGNMRKFKEEDPEGTRTGIPDRYARWGADVLYFDRTLDQDVTAVMLYKKYEALATTTTSYPDRPINRQRILINYVKWKFASDKGHRMAQQWKQEYEQALMELVVSEQNKLESAEYITQPGDPDGIIEPTYKDYLNRVYG